MDENLLVRCMPSEIADDLLGAGASFEIATGKQIDPKLLTGSHVFIVTGGVASKFIMNSNGRLSEVGMVGNEGMFPACGLMDVPGTRHLVLAQIGPLVGRVVRTKDFHAIVSASSEASKLVQLYLYSFITQVATNLMTAEQNSVAARVARWLLMCHDRINGDVINVTHETLADMSHSQRPTITKTLSEFRDSGLIGMERGHLEILSRSGLRDRACGGYGAAAAYFRAHIGPFGRED